jgi:hypothetical protein
LKGQSSLLGAGYKFPDIDEKRSIQAKNISQQPKEVLMKIKEQRIAEMSKVELFGNKEAKSV